MPIQRYMIGMALIGFMLGSVACGSWTNYEDFPCKQPKTTITYTQFVKPFLAKYCDSCHSANSTQRRGAPIAYVFDTYEATVALKRRIFLRAAANNTTMPPGPDDPPEEERLKLAEWIVCDSPR